MGHAGIAGQYQAKPYGNKYGVNRSHFSKVLQFFGNSNGINISTFNYPIWED